MMISGTCKNISLLCTSVLYGISYKVFLGLIIIMLSYVQSNSPQFMWFHLCLRPFPAMACIGVMHKCAVSTSLKSGSRTNDGSTDHTGQPISLVQIRFKLSLQRRKMGFKLSILNLYITYN